MTTDKTTAQLWARRLFFASAAVFIILFSIRQLSDPDLGFHLKYGEWIASHHVVPYHDYSTYTVSGHSYIDLHWLFQLILSGIYSLSGYSGLTLFVALLFLGILALAGRRNRLAGISRGMNVFLLILAALMIGSRVLPRPEMFTYIFLLLNLLILDAWFREGKQYLYFLPLIQLLWCNMHGLFILGLITMASYTAGSWKRDHRPDRRLVLTFLASLLICLVNPYFLEGLLFPFRLMTRLNGSNIFHQHISEFRSLFMVKEFTPELALFIVYTLAVVWIAFRSRNKIRLHEWILLSAMLILSLSAVRNIPLFVLVSLPVAGRLLPVFADHAESHSTGFFRKFIAGSYPKPWIYMVMVFLMVSLACWVTVGNYYESNKTNFRFGAGLDKTQQPEDLSDFVLTHRLNGKVLNSLGTGGWLSWRLPQPVYIDGRLEVMQEDIYNELSGSWTSGLRTLTDKYQPDLVIYNYLKYYPWTASLKDMHDWRLLYADGLFAMFAKQDYRPELPALTEDEVVSGLMNSHAGSVQLQNAGMFCLQLGWNRAAADLLTGALTTAGGRKKMIETALTEARQRMAEPPSPELQPNSVQPAAPPAPAAGSTINHDQAVKYYNEGNQLYQSGNIQGAYDNYSKAIRFDPGYVKAYNNRGNVLALQNKFEDALRDFDAAIRLNPGYSDAYLGKGSSLYYSGDREGARKAWEMAVSLGNKRAADLLRQAFHN